MTRRLMRRAIGRGEITVPAVPGMVEEYVTMCDDTFGAMGCGSAPRIWPS